MAINPKLTQAAEQCAKKKAKAKKSVAGEAPAKSKGKKLDSETRKEMEKAFGAKLSDVQVHTGPEAKDAAKKIGAKAFTVGNDIFFASPGDSTNPELLAHCLSHVIQQRGGVKKGKVDVIK